MKDIVHKLFDGEIVPDEMERLNSEEYKEQDKKYRSCRRSFEQKLPKELTDEYETLVKAEGDYFYEHELNAFRKGFKLGMQLAIEGMNK